MMEADGVMLPPGNTASHKKAEEAKAYSQVFPGRLPSSSLGVTPWASKPQGPEFYCPQFWDDLFWEAHGSECLG